MGSFSYPKEPREQVRRYLEDKVAVESPTQPQVIKLLLS